MMRRVLDYASMFGKAVMVHCQDEALVGEGQVNEGVVSTRLGMLGWPAEGEEVEIARDIMLCRLTGCPLHIQHISTKTRYSELRAAKAEGLPVTCEVTPHHLFLCEDDIDSTYNTSLKVNPPLRTAEDAAALVEGVKDGSVDCIVTDHAPHTAYEKAREFELAPFGMVGLETSLGSLVTNLVSTGALTWSQLVELMAVNPRRVLNVEQVSIQPGMTADLTVIDPDVEWTVDPAEFASKAQNSGFAGASSRAVRPTSTWAAMPPLRTARSSNSRTALPSCLYVLNAGPLDRRFFCKITHARAVSRAVLSGAHRQRAAVS